MKSQSQPQQQLPTSYGILAYICEHKDNHEAIRAFLEDCRKKDIGKHFSHSPNPYDIICHALLTNNIYSLNAKKLEQAKAQIEASPGQVFEIIELVLKLILAILAIIQLAYQCNKASGVVKLVDILRTLDGTNPLMNLAGLQLADVDLTGVNLKGVNLSGSYLVNLNLTGVNFDETNLKEARIKDCNLDKAHNLAQAKLDWANFKGSTINENALKNLYLEKYLKIILPANVKLAELPTTQHAQAALDLINKEFEEERKLATCFFHQAVDKFDRSFHRHLIARNLVKIAREMKSKEKFDQFIIPLIDAPFFKNHLSAQVMGAFNTGFTRIHNLFTAHRKVVPFFGNYDQNILISAFNEEEKKRCQPACAPSIRRP